MDKENQGLPHHTALIAYLDLIKAHTLGVKFPPDIEDDAYALINASPYADHMLPFLAALDDPEELERLTMQTHIEWLAFMVSRGADEHTIDFCNRHLYEAVTGHDPGPTPED